MARIPLVLLTLTLTLGPAALARSPVIPGLARDGTSARDRGLVLLGELGCTACHAAGSREASISRKEAPDLRSIAARARATQLKNWLADPHGVKPGTTMPDLLARFSGRERREEIADALRHYLLSLTDVRPPTAGDDVTPELAAEGRSLYHSIGCVACHSPRDAAGRELSPEDSVPLAGIESKYSVESLAAFLEDPLRSRPSGRMPRLHLTPNEAFRVACYLAGTGGKSTTGAPPAVDAKKARRGKQLFAELGCASCHGGLVESRTSRPVALASADPLEGCLSGESGAWPDYDLDDRQRADIRAALATETVESTGEGQIRKTLVTFNCIACHARGDLGGVPANRNEFYLSRDQSLGETGRIPPPLTGVGAKLQPEWLRKTLVGGQAIRSYLSMRMPAFGRGNAEHLAELFAREDSVPPVDFPPPPRDRKKAREFRDIGHRLVGDKGMNCIACHTFRGRQVGAMAAVDIIETMTRRLTKNWFYSYMLDPPSFRSITIMPQYFPDGESILKDIAGGDPKTQIDAMWRYLDEGRNTRAPSGVRRPPMEIVVGDEAVLLRRSAQDTGKRAISVGYPAGVHLTFDAESVSVNQIWRGKFIDAVGVWTGQGSGQARVLSRDRVRFGMGPAFARLPNPRAPWPDKTRRELGIRFHGYELDEKRRPTFRYAVGNVAVTDRPIDIPATSGSAAFLARTLTLRSPGESPGAPGSLYFRIAVNPRIELIDGGVAEIDEKLRISARKGDAPSRPLELVVREVENARELIVAIPDDGGSSTLTLEYRWKDPEEDAK